MDIDMEKCIHVHEHVEERRGVSIAGERGVGEGAFRERRGRHIFRCC